MASLGDADHQTWGGEATDGGHPNEEDLDLLGSGSRGRGGTHWMRMRAQRGKCTSRDHQTKDWGLFLAVVALSLIPYIRAVDTDRCCSGSSGGRPSQLANSWQLTPNTTINSTSSHHPTIPGKPPMIGIYSIFTGQYKHFLPGGVSNTLTIVPPPSPP